MTAVSHHPTSMKETEMNLGSTRRHRLGAHLAAAALAGSALALVGAPAHAAADANDPSFTPVAADLIGVGSDTTQIALHQAAEAYSTANPGFNVASFAATGGGQITLPSGAINRPNGSGAGKALLYGSANNTDIDFARSSSTLSDAEKAAGLQQIPFALDTMVMAVSNSTASHAPATLTPAQVVAIYKGDITNWSQVGGTAGDIQPYRPQDGSGTLSFFKANLKAANGGVDVTFASSVKTTQEQDDTDIKSNADAIVPISLGRAKLLGSTLRFEGQTAGTNFVYPRAVYDVVRAGVQGDADVQAFFGSSGYLCSDAAKSLIEAGGLEQLATPAAGGVCGAATQNAVTNFATNVAVDTTTALKVTSTSAGKATLTATVTASNAPSGSVTFYQGETVVAAGVPLSSGRAVVSVKAAPGAQTYSATFTPDSPAAFRGSSDEATGTVLAAAKLTSSVPTKVKKGKTFKASVTVLNATTGKSASGTVSIRLGTKTVAKGTLRYGKVSITVPKITKTATYTIVYGGSSTVYKASKSVKVTATS